MMSELHHVFQSPWKEFCWLASKLAPIQPPVFFLGENILLLLRERKRMKLRHQERKKDTKKEEERGKEGNDWDEKGLEVGIKDRQWERKRRERKKK